MKQLTFDFFDDDDNIETYLDNDDKTKINQKPLISYYGGKQRIISKLIPLIHSFVNQF